MSDIDTRAARARLDAALMAADPYRTLDDVRQSGVIRDMLPEVQAIVGFGGGRSGHKDLWDHTRRVVAQCPMTLLVRWAALFHDVGKPDAFRHDQKQKVTFHGHEARSTDLFTRVARRTGMFTAAEEARITVLLVLLARSGSYSPEWDDSAVRRLSRDAGAAWDDLIALTRADCTTGRPEKREHVQALAGELDARRRALCEADAVLPALPKGLGDALVARFGRPPGKWLGDLMGELRGSVERGELPRSGPIDAYVAAVDGTAGR